MTTIIYEYQIPDPDRPISAEDRALGPSGELMDFKPAPVSPEQVLHRKVDDICPYAGTYGMGGPGFFGLQMGAEWLVIAIRGAGEWMTAKGRAIEDTFYEKYGRPRPWLGGGASEREVEEDFNELKRQMLGQAISEFEVGRRSLKILFDNDFDLTIEEDPANRPLREGSKEPRAFKPDDDLRRAVFLSLTTEIWV